MELLSPAGNFDKLKAAVAYGADAVYLAGREFGLRASAGNFGYDEMAEAFKYLHERGKKGYVTVNIFPSTKELENIKIHLKKIDLIGVDGIIVSDPGVFSIVKNEGIKTPISISTQANTTNLAAVNFWASMGADRVILAREIVKDDLADICKNANCEVELFIHGAICISMSGRCLISTYMTGKDANHGECTHPCRWNYHLVENTREGEYFPVYEDEKGTYLYNSKDLSMIRKIGELVDMGVSSAKIEGRMKSVMYVSIVTAVYRAAIDNAMKNRGEYKVDPRHIELLSAISNRGYIEGYYEGKDDLDAINQDNEILNNTAVFLATVDSSTDDEMIVSARAKFLVGEEINIFSPNLIEQKLKIEALVNVDGAVEENTRPNYKYKIRTPKKIKEGSLLLRFK